MGIIKLYSTTIGESTLFIEFMLGVIWHTISNIKKDVPINDPRNVPTKRFDDIIRIISENRNITIAQLSPYNINILG